ncbi:hypothetical protein GGR52DRAFT_253499 [Hypoxylon sp. FL1284]|nr:hypothetical protein GGR52DRAFT_253499 [Hypoxylon sp. FL1284]
MQLIRQTMLLIPWARNLGSAARWTTYYIDAGTLGSSKHVCMFTSFCLAMFHLPPSCSAREQHTATSLSGLSIANPVKLVRPSTAS